MTEKKKLAGAKPRAGHAAVELALISPVLALLLLGAGDFGRAFYAAITVANAAHAGVLYGIQSNATTSNSTAMRYAASNDAANLVNLGGVTTTATRICKCADGASVGCITGSCGVVSGITTRPNIYLTVTAATTFNTVAPYPGIPSTVSVNAQDTMRAQ